MPTSPAGRANSTRPGAGFTLIELLVVVAIIAILSVGAGLTAGGAFARPGGASTAQRIEQGAARVRDEALLGRTVVGLYPRADGWIAARRDGDRWRRAGAALTLRGATLSWTVDERGYLPGLNDPGPRDAPPIQFAPDGGSTPFSLTILSGSTRQICRAGQGEALACD